jgi:hypothetical protein
MTQKQKPDLTDYERGRLQIAKLRAMVTDQKPEVPARRPDLRDLGEVDPLEYPDDARVRYDTDVIDAFFRASGWSDYQMWLLAYAISVEYQGPNAVQEIQKLSRADAAWARHLATSREPQGGVQRVG